jgi:O-antigen/teichoic acid export membrane protein
LYGPLHLNLAEVVGLIVISRVLAVAVFAWFVRKVDHRAFSLRSRFTGSMRQLLRYAGWVTVSNIFSPVLNFAERLLLAALMPLGMIGFYTAPYEIISRLPMIPASIGMTLFPSFSSGLGASGETALERLFVRPTKLILFIVTPLTAFFVFFPREILSLWLGADFGEKSHGVLVFLAVGFFLNCLAHVPLAAMYGLGRPDLRAKIDITEAFVFVVASYAMIVLGGITGAAATKAAALGLDVIAMFLLLERILKVGLRSLMPDHLLYFALTSFSFLGIGLVLDLSSVDLAMKLTSFLVAGVVFVYLFVTRFLTADERAMAFSVARFQNWP